MLKNWRTIAKIVVAVLTALLGTVGATLADGVAPLFSICDRYADNVSHEAGLARFWQNVWQNKLNI